MSCCRQAIYLVLFILLIVGIQLQGSYDDEHVTLQTIAAMACQTFAALASGWEKDIGRRNKAKCLCPGEYASRMI
jgi:hypothetical protein